MRETDTNTATNADARAGAEATLLAELQAFVGLELGARVAPEAVNAAMIRHWVEAMDDRNPVYTDPAAAAASVHGEIIAPAAMLQAWTMDGLRGRDRAPDDTDPQARLLHLLESHGFVGVVATNCEQEYLRMLHLGERVTATSVIDSVSGEKSTGLGAGHFVTTRVEYRTGDGELVGRQLWRLLKYRPGTGQPPAAPASTEGITDHDASPTARPRRPRPGTTDDTRFFFDGAREHRLLIQRCAACQVLRHPPQPRCDRCGSYEWDALEASGRGRVYSFVGNPAPQVPAFDYPLPIGLIELDEGTRLVAEIVECPVESIAIGMPVEVTWIDDGDLSLPAFRPPGTVA